MGTRRMSEKYNYSCLKIFEMIALFSSKNPEFSEVIKLFANEDGSLAQKSNVLLNKYMNTLDIFGIKVKKIKHTYYLQKMPFNLNLDEKDLYAVSLIKAAKSIMPSGKSKNAIEGFLNDLSKRYDTDTKDLDKAVDNTRNYDLSFYFKQFEERVAECEQYCQDEKPVEIYFTNHDGDDIRLICEPREIKYGEHIIFFRVYNNLTQRIFDIPIGSIKHVRELSGYIGDKKRCTTVLFKVKDGLAKRYKVRKRESIEQKNPDGSMVIKNSGEDFNELLVRLFKYQENCEILLPKYLRTRLEAMIDKTLKNYVPKKEI